MDGGPGGGLDGVAVWLVLVAVPTAAFWGLSRALDAWTRSGPPRRARRTAVAPGRSLEQLVADLRRLDLDCRRCAEQGAPGPRRRAAALAYDDALAAVARALDVPAPGPAPLDPVDRLQVEAELVRRGVVW